MYISIMFQRLGGHKVPNITGHERIAMMRTGIITADKRPEDGYRIAMKESRLSIKDGWVINGDLSISGARKATRSLMSRY